MKSDKHPFNGVSGLDSGMTPGHLDLDVMSGSGTVPNGAVMCQAESVSFWNSVGVGCAAGRQSISYKYFSALLVLFVIPY